MKPNLNQYMIKAPYVCEPDVLLSEAYALMREQDVRHLPVTQDEKLVGLLSERDIKEKMSLFPRAMLTVADVMKTEVYAIPSQTSLKDVAIDMANNKYGSAVVVNKNDEVIGIFTTTDALRVLADLLEEDPVSEALLEDFVDGWDTEQLIYL